MVAEGQHSIICGTPSTSKLVEFMYRYHIFVDCVSSQLAEAFVNRFVVWPIIIFVFFGILGR